MKDFYKIHGEHAVGVEIGTAATGVNFYLRPMGIGTNDNRIIRHIIQNAIQMDDRSTIVHLKRKMKRIGADDAVVKGPKGDRCWDELLKWRMGSVL